MVRDEHPRADSSLEQLAKLRPVLLKTDPESTVTAGNASGQNDSGSSVHSHPSCTCRGARPSSHGAAGVVGDRRCLTAEDGRGPRSCDQASAVDRAGLQFSDMDLIELNEAFAAQVLAVTREWKFTDSDFQRLNVNGSGISLGHPVGATGGRILATLAHEMDRRQVRYGLEAMCIGGGQGLAAVFERVA